MTWLSCVASSSLLHRQGHADNVQKTSRIICGVFIALSRLFQFGCSSTKIART
jgi:hypothetical protein